MSCKPVGKVSPSVIADWAGLVPVLVKVKTRVVVAPSAIEPAPKVLATVGDVTVNVALVVAPVSATGPVADGAVVVFRFVLVAVTLCVMVQVPPGTIVPALKPTFVPALAPPVKVALPAPLQLTLPLALLVSVPI